MRLLWRQVISSSFFLKIFFHKRSQILLGGGLEEHCWDNVLVAVVLLNFRPPSQYHPVPRSTLQYPRVSQSTTTVALPARILFPKRGFLFPCLTKEPQLIIITTIYTSLLQAHFHHNYCHFHAQPNHWHPPPAQHFSQQEFKARTGEGNSPICPHSPGNVLHLRRWIASAHGGVGGWGH